MNRNANGLRNRFLTPLVEEGLLIRKYPAEPNRPDQAYTRAKSRTPMVDCIHHSGHNRNLLQT